MANNLTLDRNAMKDRATSHLRIYVGNLTEQATLDGLYDHFQPYGKVQGVVINRGFGFVQFEEESSALEAIAKGNGSHYLGKNVIVKSAQSNADKAKRDQERSEGKPSLPAAIALSDNNIPPEEGADEYRDTPYDEYGNYMGEGGGGWEESRDNWGRDGGRGRGGPRGRRGIGARGARQSKGPAFRERSPLGPRGDSGDWGERGERGERGGRGGGYDRYPPPQEFPRALPVSDKNDCEIIVVSKSLTEYAEYIEGRLKRLGIVVDLLFPMEHVPIGKVLGNIASRGCLYAILVMPQNSEHQSLTLNILHGLPQEHRNMPVEDALQLISRNFQELQRGGGAAGREAVYALLGQLADGKTLTALQYDKVIKYLQERREHQVKVELGEPLDSVKDKTQVDLQQRILSILNDTKKAEPPQPVAPAQSQQKLLNDPTVRKALDSILQKFV